jgi:hypothetical protein
MIARTLQRVAKTPFSIFKPEKKAALFFSLLFISFFINSCKKESNFFPDDVTIIFKVYDDRDSLVSGAKISVYDSYQAYQSGVLAQNIGFSIDSSISNPGGSKFTLKAKTDYWILATYNDPVRSLKLSNVTISSQLDQQDKGTEINAKIKIVPSNANISFWTDGTNQVPITVYFNSLTANISGTLTFAPTAPGNPNAVNFNVLPGTYSYYAKGQRNCLWTGSVKVANGSFSAVKLNTCNTGQITFFNTNTVAPAGTFPISVVLDNLDNAGQITTATPAYTCGMALDPNALNIYRDPNTYTYVAQTADKSSTWTGTFTLTANGCVNIQLP